jgi:carbon monoxide dehydrogenase subunit G
MRLEREVHLDAPPKEVYELVMDPRRLEEWVSIHQSLEEAPEGILTKGAKIRQKLKLAGRPFEVRWTVTKNDRPKHVVWRGEGPIGSTAGIEYGFEEEDGGTRFRYVNEYDLPGGTLGRFAGRFVAGSRIPDRELDRSLEKLKRLLQR